jgi:hypothetical protein
MMRRMRRTRLISRYFVIVIFLILLITTFLPQTFSESNDDNNKVVEDNSTTPRSPRAGTLTVDGSSSRTITQDYDQILVKDNGTLIINDNIAIQTSKGKGRLIVRDNGTVVINNGKIVRIDLVSAYCMEFQIKKGASIINSKNIYIHTQNAIELEEVFIECSGERGSAASQGEDSTVELVSNKTIKIFGGSDINAKGGDGGNGDYGLGRSDGGNGGEGKILVQANDNDKDSSPSIQILGSSLEATGGNGGTGDNYYDTIGDGGDGGAGVIAILSMSKDNNDQVDIEKSDIIAEGGLIGYSGGQTGAVDGVGGDAPVNIECKKLFMDEFKQSNETNWTEGTTTTQYLNSEIRSICEYPSITISAPNQAYLYFPNIKGGNSGIPNFEIIKAKGPGTIVNIYNLLSIDVVDNAGEKLSSAQIDIIEKKTQTTVVSGTSDNDGNEIFLIPGYKIKTNDNKAIEYIVKAVFSGITETYPDDVKLSDRYNEIKIEITLVEVIITDLEFGDQKFSPPEGGTKVGGRTVTVEGTAKPSGTNSIVSVEVEVITAAGGIPSQEAEDISASQDKTKWRYSFDSTTFTDRTDITVEVTARDSAGRSSSALLDLKVRQDVIPRPPTVMITLPSNNANITDREGDEVKSKVWINGTAIDPDWDVLREDSREVVEIRLVIKDEAGLEVLNETLEKDDGLTAINDGESYTWGYNWDTRKWSSSASKYVFPNGRYTIQVKAKDDTTSKALISDEAVINIDLYHAGLPPSDRPVAVITAVTAGENVEKDGYKYTDATNTVTFRFKSKKGKNEVSIKIDLSGSYDEDPPGGQLKFKVLLNDLDPLSWQDSAVIEKEFFGEKAREYGYYGIQVDVKDAWGWENKFVMVVDEKDGTQKPVSNLTIMIDFLPADKPMGGPLSVIYPLNLSYFEIYIVFIILVILFNIAAVSMIMSKYKKINRRRKAREAALDAARQRQMAEEEKKKEDIYSPLQFVEEGPEAEPGQVAVAGASAISEIPQPEAAPERIEDLLKPAEPEAPQLVSVAQPIREPDDHESADKPPEVSPVTTPEPTQAQPVTPAPVPAPAQPVQAQPQPQVAQPQPQAAQPVKKVEEEDKQG